MRPSGPITRWVPARTASSRSRAAVLALSRSSETITANRLSRRQAIMSRASGLSVRGMVVSLCRSITLAALAAMASRTAAVTSWMMPGMTVPSVSAAVMASSSARSMASVSMSAVNVIQLDIVVESRGWRVKSWVARPGTPGRDRRGAGSYRRSCHTCRWPRLPCAGRAPRKVWSGPGCR